MEFSSPLRTLLVLGRVSNLPTVWTNCLAGWWLGGGGNLWLLPCLFVGVSLLYTGGMFLNDAFDVDFDRQRRPERPIPTGKISARQVWQWGFGQLTVGILLLFFCGQMAALAAFFLALFILLYNFCHKFFNAAPWIMGGCRFWVYIVAGATGINGLNGWVIFCGLALAFYVVGLSYVARRESYRGPLPFWPLLLLAAPVLLAMMMNAGDYRWAAVVVSAVLILWVSRCVRSVFMAGDKNVGLIVANLIAGIALVDWLAIATAAPHWMGLILLSGFGLAKLAQKFVPAT